MPCFSPSSLRIRVAGLPSAAILTALAGFWGARTSAQQTTGPGKFLEPIIVTARKQTTRESDEEVTRQVESALHDDPYIFDAHVTVATNNGVVTLSGIALDYRDVFLMKSLVRKMTGVKKVVNDIDVQLGGD